MPHSTGFGNFSMPGLIAATMPPLLDEFGMEQVAIVGASLGGMTAIKLATSIQTGSRASC